MVAILNFLQMFSIIFWMIGALAFLPQITASPEMMPFPDIPFHKFCQFIQENFDSTISLASVLCILFSLTENPELLALHARQQKGRYEGENSITVTAWMKCLSHSNKDKLADKFLKESDDASSDYKVTALGSRLDAMAKLLQLHPGGKFGKVEQKFKPVSYKAIEGIHMICPDVFQCETLSCKPCSLQQVTRIRDIPLVTLIKGFTIHDKCPVLAGKCTECNTMYYADHERASIMEGNQSRHSRVYLNSAQYLKVGQNLWVDRHFSNTVLSGIYHFHASASAYAEFWNDAVWKLQPGNSRKITRRQIWHTFVQESIRSLASCSHVNLELEDGLALAQVTKQAFSILGDKGIIRAADHHHCSECTQKYKAQTDQLSLYDPAATVGMDENTLVPRLEVEVEDSQDSSNLQSIQPPNTMQTSADDNADVRMIVLDGLVVGPSVCSPS
jgi:hypothetical protein